MDDWRSVSSESFDVQFSLSASPGLGLSPRSESWGSKEIFGPAQKKRLFQELAQKKRQVNLE